MTALADYDQHGRVWDLDPATGLLSPASGPCHGFAHVPRQGGEYAAAALYASGPGTGTLWLQYGARRWDCAAVSVRQASLPDGTRRFTVSGAGRRGGEGLGKQAGDGPDLELPYPAPDPGAFDPAYDWTDALADDFFAWAADRLATPEARRALLEHFLAGFPAP
ncbi:hypothetical protein DMA15_35320 [Streptomyces sp. WAC 01529]|uniref:hypothetical protein n=1 Tax=Streptomyces sp. WAC 01529 TaxID=2203205 RepID=UPI000F6C5D56|nr:hypothetical protein [Streptomyces sp. WAC 01529]AZM57179.1 hypothetical protein DMA15_35320 [Streptomyces sp. WAC 01529]